MRMLAVAAVALVLAAPSAAQDKPDDVEAKKKRLGELLKQMNQVQAETEKLMKELSGDDRAKRLEIVREVAEKYVPEMAAEAARAQVAFNERSAWANLKYLATAETDFRANDRDANRVNDYWVADVSGLYRIETEKEIRLIEKSVALADARPCVPLDKAGTLPGAAKEHASKLIALGAPAPKAGYWFAVVEKYQDENGKEVKYNDGNGRCNTEFGVCAYPAEHGKTGKHTFILNEGNTVWSKDTAGKPVDVFPAEPRKAGWTLVD